MTKFTNTIIAALILTACASDEQGPYDETLPDSGFASVDSEDTDDPGGGSTGSDGAMMPSGPDDMKDNHMSADGGDTPTDCAEIEAACASDVEAFDEAECLDSNEHAGTCNESLACNIEHTATARADTAFCIARADESCASEALFVACLGGCDDRWLECMHDADDAGLCYHCEFDAAVCASECWPA